MLVNKDDEELTNLPESGSIDDKIEIQKEKKLKHSLHEKPLKNQISRDIYGMISLSQDDPLSSDFIPLKERNYQEQARWWANYFRRKEKMQSIQHHDAVFDEPIVQEDEFKGFMGELNSI